MKNTQYKGIYERWYIWTAEKDMRTWQLSNGLIAQLVDHCTGIAEVMGSNPVQAWIFFGLLFHNCLSCVHNCDDQSRLHIKYLCYAYKVTSAVRVAQNKRFHHHISVCLLLQKIPISRDFYEKECLKTRVNSQKASYDLVEDPDGKWIKF